MVVCPSCGEENPERAKFCMSCAAPLAAPPRREARKTVTVIFTDLSGSTAMGERLDAESVVRVLAAYFDTMKTVLERHGATVAKFIGDAIMAVFGIPQVHEDDALRAVRAVAEMREALVAFNAILEREYDTRIAIRTGVYTGEVFAGEEDVGSSLALGDPVNTAARLEQAAGTNEILLGDDTYRLVRDAVEVEPVDPIAAKGKAEPVTAWRLLSVSSIAPGRRRRVDTALIARDGELQVLLENHAAAVEQRSCRTVGVIGAAGVGKSRLMAELQIRLSDDALVLTGRCLPYGTGITFWPIAEIVRHAAGIVEADDPATARAKLAAITADEPAGTIISDRVAEVLGLAAPSPGAEEVPWALRRFLEALARTRPLILIIDDLQWGEAGLVDLLENLSGLVSAPLLLICVARPELSEAHPDFAERTRAEVLRLGPLDQHKAELLLTNLIGAVDLPAGFAERILTAAEGNPLFVEELLGMLIDEGQLRFEDGRWTATQAAGTMALPPSISAVLSARLDRLSPLERVVVESASVVGQEFELSAVTHVVSDDMRLGVSGYLDALIRRELVSPADPSPLDQQAYRFQHLLFRDAAYEGMAKAARATFHAAVAEWLEGAAGERITEYEAIVGYHLERAHKLRVELGATSPEDGDLAQRACDWLARSGRRALAQEDFVGSANLLSRAVDLADEDHQERPALLLALADALVGTGDLTRADRVLTDALETAARAGDERLRCHGIVALSAVRRWTCAADQPSSTDLEQAIDVFTAHGDERGLALAWLDRAQPMWEKGELEEGDEMARTALVHARTASDRATVARLLGNLALSAVLGPMPATAGIQFCATHLDELSGSQVGEARLSQAAAVLHAMRGEFDAAREMLARTRTIYRDLGMTADDATLALDIAQVERLADHDALAEQVLLDSYRTLEAIGERWVLTTVAARLAHVRHALGRDDEAEHFVALAEEDATDDDVVTLLLVKSARAKLLAGTGNTVDATRHAREAVELASSTDWLNDRAGALVDLAEVLCVSGHNAEAAAHVDEAIAIYDAKENMVEASRARRRRAALDSATCTDSLEAPRRQ